MLPDFNSWQWVLAVIAGLGVGVSKSGLPGVSLLHVVVMAQLFPGAASTGVVLPMLVAGDLGAVALYRRSAQWSHLARTLPPACVGVVTGWMIMSRMRDLPFGPVIGWIVLGLALMQSVRYWRPRMYERAPHTRAFAWTMGLVAGVTTMLANAAGPVVGLYLLAVALPKEQFVGTSAWFFLVINLVKVPFSVQLGLINGPTLAFNAVLLPVIAAGLLGGHYLVRRLPQQLFDGLVLAFAVVAALRLIGAV